MAVLTRLQPLDALLAAPRAAPLIALLSCDDGGPWSRWSILARPRAAARALARPDGSFAYESIGPIAPPRGKPLDALAALIASTARGPAPHHPFSGGWIGWISYDLGRILEPTAQAPAPPRAIDDRGLPLWEFAHCPDAAVHDAATGLWSTVGEGLRLTEPVEHPAELDRPTPILSREAFEARAARAAAHIRDGDAFQVNLANRFTAPFRGCSRTLFTRLASRTRPWFGAYMESMLGGPAILSLSPELFLDLDADRITTRPMKGTLPGDLDPAALERSPKDRAELAMIVDLMRNDLGRIAEFSSVRVRDARVIERHAGARPLWQGVATVEARLRLGVGIASLLHATFPPGSITGAPKIRAMRIIDELEPVRRGPYCGCLGYSSDCGRIRLAVSIRTAVISGHAPRPGWFDPGTLDYGTGAGIVADSDPASEWLETMAKAGAILPD